MEQINHEFKIEMEKYNKIFYKLTNDNIKLRKYENTD